MMHGPSLLQGRGDVTGLCWLELPVPPALGQNGDESELFIPSLGYSWNAQRGRAKRGAKVPDKKSATKKLVFSAGCM